MRISPLAPVPYPGRGTLHRMLPRYLTNPAPMWMNVDDLRRVVAAERITPLRDFRRDYFDFVEAVREAGFSLTNDYVYESPLRPLSPYVLRDKDIGRYAIVRERYLASEHPLEPSDVVRLELQPATLALADFAWRGAEQIGIPLELSTDPMTDENTRAAVIFRAPRGHWQLSWWDIHGPSGHRESDDPVQLAGEALAAKYKYVSPGIIDTLTDLSMG